jgi:hypothetical protein
LPITGELSMAAASEGHEIEGARFASYGFRMIRSGTHLRVIPEAERSEAVRNPVFQGADYWIPGSPLRGARE